MQNIEHLLILPFKIHPHARSKAIHTMNTEI